ncbi:unnamed protein product [Pneumocystis jirovecii]|uniref:CBS domain-containing protein n=2 Tax=Pneumocystis jirovecii TaxID=42068 RepID=L0PBL3_PNEJI|nr:AMP-activated serine/threonine-protein kinase regulatory subunit SNF4 [Pneumocystis jirovecii RU7]KTW32717.1 hypothetical protein T551_00202 [Pneumocystis jirovecii RU7]CCJ29010.1 unnamed protein product [Pneumocystis jirovecii]
MEKIDRLQLEALESIRQFIRSKTCYDVLPVSFRMIVLDTELLVKKSLTILAQNNIVSAPLWNTKTCTFAGLLTASDFINVIQYYHQNVSYVQALEDIGKLKLNGLRDIEKSINAPPLETISINPMRSLYEACERIRLTKAKRIPLIDHDDETFHEVVVSVLTQYRILKFIALNCNKETKMLQKPLCDLSIGTYDDLATASMDTPVIDVIYLLAKRRISSVPIVDSDGVILNIYEAVDALSLIQAGSYYDLGLTVGEALLRRSEDFGGVHTCTDNDCLDGIFDVIRRSKVHRLIVVDRNGRLKGLVSLSDILRYIMVEGTSSQ